MAAYAELDARDPIARALASRGLIGRCSHMADCSGLPRMLPEAAHAAPRFGVR